MAGSALRLLGSVLTGLSGIALMCYLVWLGWDYLGPRKPPIGPLRKAVANEVIAQVAEDLRQSRASLHSAVLLHLAGDPTDYVTSKLRETIEQNGIFDLCDLGLAEKLRDALRLRQPGFGELAAAVNAARGSGFQGVIFGTVHRLESFPGGAKMDLDITLADIASQEIICSKHYSKDTAKDTTKDAVNPARVAAVPQEEVVKISLFKRLLGWAVVALLLPVFSISFIRTMVTKESNRVNAFVLGIYTLVGILLAYLVVGADFTLWSSVLLFLFLSTADFIYNVQIMSHALRMEKS